MAEKDNLTKLKEAYDKIKKQYDLPDFDDVDKEFEIRKIDHDLFIVKEVRRLMSAKLRGIADLLEPILNPHESIQSAVETNYFAKEEVTDMFEFYKKIYHMLHQGANTSLDSQEAEAKFIKEVWQEWPEIKKKAKAYSDKIVESWAEAEKEHVPSHYTG